MRKMIDEVRALANDLRGGPGEVSPPELDEVCDRAEARLNAFAKSVAELGPALKALESRKARRT